MWIPKWYIESLTKRVDDLERRTKRLELMQFEEAKNKIASLKEEKTGITSEDLFTIEEIINQ